eukprot:scaffold2790_cov239-Pinguiococcus_pyrenoidosus.AAC.12
MDGEEAPRQRSQTTESTVYLGVESQSRPEPSRLAALLDEVLRLAFQPGRPFSGPVIELVPAPSYTLALDGEKSRRTCDAKRHETKRSEAKRSEVARRSDSKAQIPVAIEGDSACATPSTAQRSTERGSAIFRPAVQQLGSERRGKRVPLGFLEQGRLQA